MTMPRRIKSRCIKQLWLNIFKVNYLSTNTWEGVIKSSKSVSCKAPLKWAAMLDLCGIPLDRYYVTFIKRAIHANDWYFCVFSLLLYVLFYVKGMSMETNYE